MVAMQQEEEKHSKDKPGPGGDDDDEEEDCEDFGDYSPVESLLSLVQPEMVTLSKHWLAALKDHALLSLPAGKQILQSAGDL